MLKVSVEMAGRGKRQVTYQNKPKGEGRIGQDTQSTRKERSTTTRHSYHQASNNNNFNLNGPMFDAGNNGHFDNQRSFVSRERSFVRPQSTHAYAQGGQTSEGDYDLQRQRSFVLPGQLQQQSRDHQQQRRRSAMPANQRGKPAMEIYRPPTLRSSSIFETNGEMVFNGKASNGIYDSQGNFISNNHYNYNMNGRKPGLNIHAKEFISYQPPILQHSKSSSSVLFQQGKIHGLHHSKSGQNLRTVNEVGNKTGENTSPSRVHFSENKENNPEVKIGMSSLSPKPATLGLLGPVASPIKRSKSLGSADLRPVMEGGQSTLPDIGPFSQEIQKTITEAMNDPNALSARQLMEVVRHVFLRVIEASRHSEPTARICISIIEKEKGETFLETLLNTCQEYFQERDRLLRNTPPAPYPGYVAAHPRWIGYMSFLNEMYTQLKRRHVQLMTRRMRNSETAPGLLLLTLLAQCCHVCLREPAVNSLAETECLFFVLTAVGKDIEVELPQHMARVMGAARDAFLTSVRVPAVRKTLLQLIEMHAARWNLPAPAVMYYYPGSGAK